MTMNIIVNYFTQLGPNRAFEVGHCTCKAGVTGNCKHVAALVVYVNEFEEASCTNQQQKWGINSTNNSSKVLHRNDFGKVSGNKLCFGICSTS